MKKLIYFTISLCLLSISVNAQIQVGDIAPDFTITDTEGVSHTLSDYTSAGQYVMLDFFFTTCVPCQYYTPQISLAYQTYGCNNGDIVVLGIDYGDTDPQVIQYEQTYGAIYPSASGDDGGGNAVVSDYGIFAFPFVCLIDASNEVVEIFDTPTMQVFNYYFPLYGIEEMECTTGLEKHPTSDAVKIYPNPASSFIRIDAAAGTFVSIYNAEGRCVVDFRMEKGSSRIDLSGFKKGLYFLKTIRQGHQTVKKFTIGD